MSDIRHPRLDLIKAQVRGSRYRVDAAAVAAVLVDQVLGAQRTFPAPANVHPIRMDPSGEVLEAR